MQRVGRSCRGWQIIAEGGQIVAYSSIFKHAPDPGHGTSVRRYTVGNREMGTGQIGTILEFASVPLKKIGTDLLGSWWP